jgi:hypothetical protein
MSRWTRILTLSLLPVAAAALGSAPSQESAPAKQSDSSHKKKSNPSAEHGATKKSSAGAKASLNPQPIPPGRTKSARKTATTTTGSGKTGQFGDDQGRHAQGNSSRKKTSKTKVNTPSTKKTSATPSRQTGNDKGIIFVGGKKTQKTQKTRT